MGRKDIITKEYMEDTEVFADVFNHMIYKGEKVIDPKNLKELDTAISMIMTAAVTGTAVTVGILTGEAAIMTAMTMIMMMTVAAGNSVRLPLLLG